MKIRNTSIIAILLCSASATALANTTYTNVAITQIASGGAYGGDVVLKLSNYDGSARPACATDPWGLRFDATTDAGKQAYALALLAWSTGKRLAISGEGTCIPGTGSEELRWIRGL